MIGIALTLSVVSLLASLATLGLAVAVTRQSGAVATTLQRHRLGHEKREGKPDPAPHTERRKLNVGPSRATGERRRSPGQLLPPEDLPPEDLAPARPRLPRPGQIGH